jgi:hypothetical protein
LLGRVLLSQTTPNTLHTSTSTGELAHNQDSARQRICNWLDGHDASACAFDFVLKGVLQVMIVCWLLC